MCKGVRTQRPGLEGSLPFCRLSAVLQPPGTAGCCAGPGRGSSRSRLLTRVLTSSTNTPAETQEVMWFPPSGRPLARQSWHKINQHTTAGDGAIPICQIQANGAPKWLTFPAYEHVAPCLLLLRSKFTERNCR